MIFSFEGNQREGKSLGATALGIYLARLAGNIPVVANYHITQYQPFLYFQKPSELENIYNSVIIYDELGTSADARTWNSQQQVKFTHVFAQMGKRGNTLIFTAQRIGLVELRVRQQTDIVIECQKNYLTGTLTQIWSNTQRGRERARLIGKYIVAKPESIYSYYDTYEIIETNTVFNDQIGRR